MPELPEVETVVRGIRPGLVGNTVTRLELLHPRVYRHSHPKAMRCIVEGSVIQDVTRRGKFILLHLDGNRPPLAIHLRMSGKLLFEDNALQSPHLRASLYLAEGPALHFVDTRTFGTFFLVDGTEPNGFRTLGPEPLSSRFTRAEFARILGGSRTPVKTYLLRQDKIAGIGNIYASEALWMARVSPKLAAGALKVDQIGRLHRAIRKVLRDAVNQMGTTFSDFRRPGGQPGEYGNNLHVYGRAGEPCPRCRQPIERLVQHGRSTFFCSKCQRGPRRD